MFKKAGHTVFDSWFSSFRPFVGFSISSAQHWSTAERCCRVQEGVLHILISSWQVEITDEGNAAKTGLVSVVSFWSTVFMR